MGAASLVAALLVSAGAPGQPPQGPAATALELRSPSFAAMAAIPRRYTCEGEDVSPELRWSGVPERAQSLVLIVEDPDAPDPAAPQTIWVHWVLYELPADATGLPEAVSEAGLPPGTRQGANDWKRTGYRGPCPPIGRHRYVHRLYALDAKLGDLGHPGRAELLKAMSGKVIAQAELIGTYQEQR